LLMVSFCLSCRLRMCIGKASESMAFIVISHGEVHGDFSMGYYCKRRDKMLESHDIGLTVLPKFRVAEVLSAATRPTPTK
jgi:hypothetical protein